MSGRFITAASHRSRTIALEGGTWRPTASPTTSTGPIALTATAASNAPSARMTMSSTTSTTCPLTWRAQERAPRLEPLLLIVAPPPCALLSHPGSVRLAMAITTTQTNRRGDPIYVLTRHTPLTVYKRSIKNAVTQWVSACSGVRRSLSRFPEEGESRRWRRVEEGGFRKCNS